MSSEGENRKRRGGWRNWREGGKRKRSGGGPRKRRGESRESRFVHRDVST